MQNTEKLEFLKDKAKELRKNTLTMIYTAQSGHPGGSLSAADMMTALYFSEMNIDPENPKLPERDKKIIILRYFRDKTQSEVAKELGISRSYVSRIEKKALQKLKNHME